MIYLSLFKKVNENGLIDYHLPSDKDFENINTKEGKLIGCYQSQNNNLTWFAYRKSSHEIRIEVRDEKNGQYSYLDLEDCCLDSEVTFKGFSDNRVIVSLTAGQDGSQDFCLEFVNQIKSSQRFPVFENDGLSNVWKINNSYGVFSTTEERWFVFHLETLEIIDEMVIDICQGDFSGIDTLFPTGNQLIFRCYLYNEGTKEVEYMSVEKRDLESILEKIS